MPRPLQIREAARFLTMALLISNGIRRDTVVILNVRGGWLIAPGDRLRHLRPDADTSEGWIRAVLRGRPLGAIVTDSVAGIGRVIVLHHKPGNGVGELELLYRAEPPWALCYINGDGECGFPIDRVLKVPNWGLWRTSIIVSIILDNIGKRGLC